MTYYIHINRGTIDGNRKHGKLDPPIAVRTGKYGHTTYCNDVRIANGRIRYDSAGILPCGAKVVIETEEAPEIVA